VEISLFTSCFSTSWIWCTCINLSFCQHHVTFVGMCLDNKVSLLSTIWSCTTAHKTGETNSFPWCGSTFICRFVICTHVLRRLLSTGQDCSGAQIQAARKDIHESSNWRTDWMENLAEENHLGDHCKWKTISLMAYIWTKWIVKIRSGMDESGWWNNLIYIIYMKHSRWWNNNKIYEYFQSQSTRTVQTIISRK